MSSLTDVPAEPTGGSANYFLQWADTGDTFSWVDVSTIGGGTIGGSIANDQVAVGSGVDTIEGTSSLTFVSGTGVLSVGVNDTTQGGISIYGDSTINGAFINLYNSDYPT